MRRYLRLYRAMVLASLQREIEFRANFWAKVAQNLVWMGFFIAILKVFYGQTDSIAGWSEGQSFLLFATCYMMGSVAGAVFGMSVVELPTMVRLGTLDYVLVKPVDSQFWVSVRLFNFDQVGTVAASFGLLAYGLRLENLSPSPHQVLVYVVLTVAALLLFYALQFVLMTLGIWLVRVENLWVVGESVFQVARFPLDIFPALLQKLFLYAIPLAFIATVPTRALWGQAETWVIWLGVGWSLAAVIACRWFWRFALRYYTSASS
ncbi:MAG: ABC-2 family transporter protein [Fimbriimonadia bacterium]